MVLSYQREQILTALQQSPTPLEAGIVANRIHNDYQNVRKTLQRMLHVGQVVSPSRGFYTTPDHPCLTQPIDNTTETPPQLPVPTVPPVPNQQSDASIEPASAIVPPNPDPIPQIQASLLHSKTQRMG